MNLLDGPCFCVKDAKDKVFNEGAGKHPYIYIYIKEELQKKPTTKAVQSAQGVYKGCQAKRT